MNLRKILIVSHLSLIIPLLYTLMCMVLFIIFVDTPTVSAQTVSCRTSGEIWIGKRADTLPGSGTITDPCNANTASQFDALMRSFAANSIIHIGPGIFETSGYHPFNDPVNPGNPTIGWGPRKGWKLNGAGIDQTVLKLVGVKDQRGLTVYKNAMYNVIANRYDVLVDDFVLSGMTLDANLQGVPASYQVATGGLSLNGNRMKISNIKIINFGTRNPQVEDFAFSVGGARPQMGDVDGLTVDSIEISHPVTSVIETTFLAISGYDNYLINGKEYNPTGKGAGFIHNVVLRNSVFDGSGSTSETHGITVSGSIDALVQGNTVRNMTFGIYQDSWRTKSATFRGNTLSNVLDGIFFNFSTIPPYRLYDSVTIDANTIELKPTLTGPVTFGIEFNGKITRPYNFGTAVVTNNIIRLFQATTTTNNLIWGIGGGAVENLTVTNNSIQLDQGYQQYPLFFNPLVATTTCMGNVAKNAAAIACPGRLWDVALTATSTPANPLRAVAQVTLSELLPGGVGSDGKFEFDCQNDGVVDITIPPTYVSGTTIRTATCTYPKAGIYTISATTTYGIVPINKTTIVQVR
jgi:hypothetical protein